MRDRRSPKAFLYTPEANLTYHLVEESAMKLKLIPVSATEREECRSIGLTPTSFTFQSHPSIMKLHLQQRELPWQRKVCSTQKLSSDSGTLPTIRTKLLLAKTQFFPGHSAESASIRPLRVGGGDSSALWVFPRSLMP